MKSDIDRLMADLRLDAIVVVGDEAPNPYRDYLTNRSKANGTIIKKRGQEAAFIVGPMEIGEAASSGLKAYTDTDFGGAEILQEYAGDTQAIERELYRSYLIRLQVSGRVAFYGVADVNATLALVLALRERMPGLEFVLGGETARLFNALYETKDAAEIAHLREAARLTSQVVRAVWDFISRHHTESDSAGSRVVDSQSQPLTIGAVKGFIRQQEAALGLDDTEGCIFAQGRDAGLPHSRGEDSDVLQVGKSIVFDISPREAGGYFHDMTRTWCIGHAPDDVQAAYQDVLAIFRKVTGSLRVGAPSRSYQVMTLDYFESKGHPTQRSQPGTFDGYVHGLGHGLGLNVHEAPSFSLYAPSSDLAPGNVFTVEPGLYYPDRGFGVRVEDTVYFDQDGSLHTLTDFHYDLVLPLRGE